MKKKLKLIIREYIKDWRIHYDDPTWWLFNMVMGMALVVLSIIMMGMFITYPLQCGLLTTSIILFIMNFSSIKDNAIRVFESIEKWVNDEEELEVTAIMLQNQIKGVNCVYHGAEQFEFDFDKPLGSVYHEAEQFEFDFNKPLDK